MGGAAARRRSRGPARATAAGGLLAVVAACAVFGVTQAGGARISDDGNQAHTAAAVQDAGRMLFLQNCASCHGSSGEGTNAGPPLIGVGAAAADFYLRTGRMPLSAPGQQAVADRPHFDEAQIEALDAFVASLGSGPAIPAVRSSSDLNRGWELYTANCAACHAATGAGNAVGGGYAAVGLHHADPTTVAEAMLVGPGVMPRFSFSDADRDALIAYVQYIRSQPAPGGTPIGGAGPVAEGFVAIVIGVPILLVVARFVGRRAEGPVEVGPSGGGSAATADGPEPPDGAEATEPGTPA